VIDLNKTKFYSYVHRVDGIIGVKENQMDLEVIAQLTVLTLMVVSGPLVIDRALDGSKIHVKYPLTIHATIPSINIPPLLSFHI
jgi:hypothetical protein